MGAEFLEGTGQLNNALCGESRVIWSSVFFVISLCLSVPSVSLW
jgi:hypothetical protein